MPQISPTSSQITLDNVNFIANTFLTRLRGLLGWSKMPKNTCLILTPCRQVHTFFMRFPIGAVFLNKQGVVLHKEVLKPWRVSKFVKDAEMVVEVEPLAARIISEYILRKKFEEEILFLCYHDQLTGLYNRRFIEEEIRRLDTPRQLPVSVIMGDVNGLKLTNDVFGHRAGDFLLKRAAEIIKESCRREDLITRWGGDEFVILLPNTPVDKATGLAEEIRGQIY